MAERVVIGDAVLYLGDCLEVLPTLRSVDAVVTDPPYGISGGSGSDAKVRRKGDYLSFNDTPEYVREVCVPAVAFSLSIATRGAVTPGNRCFSDYPRADDMGCFFHPAAVSHGPWGFVGFSPILFYGKDYRAGRGALPTSISVTERPPKNEHPCPKPSRAWAWLVNKVSCPDEVLLDPFMGSGATGVSCAELGRKFIGIEIVPKYFEIACRRIEDAQRQGWLFPENVSRSKGRDLFDVSHS